MENKIGGKSLWQDVLTVTVDTTGKKRVKITPVAITMTPGLPLANTTKRRIMMKIKCPYCGSTEYETFDTTGGDGQAISELCACFECDKTFRVIYAPDCIEKES